MSLKIWFSSSFDTFCAKHEGGRITDIFGRKWQFFRLFVGNLSGLKTAERSTWQKPAGLVRKPLYPDQDQHDQGILTASGNVTILVKL